MLGMGAEVAKDVIVEQIEKRAGQKMPRPITDADLRRTIVERAGRVDLSNPATKRGEHVPIDRDEAEP